MRVPAQVAVSGSVSVDKLMEVERYSHVMHISSTVTGLLLPELDAWDALRAALPAGTVSGAPKVCTHPRTGTQACKPFAPGVPVLLFTPPQREAGCLSAVLLGALVMLLPFLGFVWGE